MASLFASLCVSYRQAAKWIGRCTRASGDRRSGGYGIAYIPEDTVVQHIGAGDLVQVLDDWSPYFFASYIYYPSRPQNLSEFRVSVDALRYAQL